MTSAKEVVGDVLEEQPCPPPSEEEGLNNNQLGTSSAAALGWEQAGEKGVAWV
jgi:hypothetical protein